MSWEPTEEQIADSWNESNYRYRMADILKAIHANPSLAGLDAPKLPTRSELPESSMNGAQRFTYAHLPVDELWIEAQEAYKHKLVLAGYTTEDEPDVPDYTEDDVRELYNALWPDAGYETEAGMEIARRGIAAGWRKAKP